MSWIAARDCGGGGGRREDLSASTRAMSPVASATMTASQGPVVDPIHGGKYSIGGTGLRRADSPGEPALRAAAPAHGGNIPDPPASLWTMRYSALACDY